MEYKENAIEFTTNSDTATVTFSQGRYISKILKLAKDHPEVEIVALPEDNEGYLIAHIPTQYIKIGAKRRVSDKQREIFMERVKNAQRSNKSLVEEESE